MFAYSHDYDQAVAVLPSLAVTQDSACCVHKVESTQQALPFQGTNSVITMVTHAPATLVGMKQIPKPTHGSLEWLQTRHKHDGNTIVGASEVSAVMGVNPYKTVTDLAIEKMQPPVVREANDAMKRGTFLEQGLLDYAADFYGTTIVTPDVMYLNGRIIATLDGLDQSRVYEAKTTTSWMAGDACLPEWFWQAQAQMYCTDASSVTFVVLDRQLRISLFDVARDDAAINSMVKQVSAFCQAIDDDQLPTDDPLTAEQVSALHPEPAGDIELGAAGLELVERWNATKHAIKQLTQEEEAIKDALANLLRNHDAGCIDGQRIVTFKAQKRESLDSKALSTKHPELIKQFTKTSTYRVLRTVKGSTNG